MISYAYLWRSEQRTGNAEGRKVRPCAIVVYTKDEDGDSVVYVAPITHAEPTDGAAIEIPKAVKLRLGLDTARSWIITDELNRFVWPGYDLMPIARDRPDLFHWGFLPVKVFNDLKASIVQHQQDRRLGIVDRS